MWSIDLKFLRFQCCRQRCSRRTPLAFDGIPLGFSLWSFAWDTGNEPPYSSRACTCNSYTHCKYLQTPKLLSARNSVRFSSHAQISATFYHRWNTFLQLLSRFCFKFFLELVHQPNSVNGRIKIKISRLKKVLAIFKHIFCFCVSRTQPQIFHGLSVINCRLNN